MGTASFPKDERLLARPQFQKVMANGRKRRVENICTLFYLPNGLERRRLGIITSRKIGNAVARNRSRRKIREVFRRNREALANGLDIVVISGKPPVLLPFGILEQKLVDAFQHLE